MVEKSFIVMAVAGMLVAGSGVAQEKEPASICDTIWGVPVLIDNQDASVVQRLKFTGRLQGDAVYVHSNDHGDYGDLVWRRFRFGGKAKLFHEVTVHAEADFNLNEVGSDDVYNRLTDANISWGPNKAFKLKVGKQSSGFTLDGATSSKKLLTVERSIVAGNLWFSTEYFTGVSGSGSSEGWNYKLGGFSTSDDDEFGRFDSGWFGLASIGRDVTENSSLRVDYVHNEPDYTGEVGTKKLTDIMSVVSKSEFGPLGVWTDLSYARGDDAKDQSDLIGLQMMPFWTFNEMWQGVFRYSMVHCTDGPGAGLGRYPRKNLSGAKYENIHDFYLGVNCFLYGHKLKWQTGVVYNLAQNNSVGNDFNGWGIDTGIRISW